MKTLNLNRDQFAKFLFSQNKKIRNYNFDLLHDIKIIMNFAYNRENTANKNGQTITNKEVRQSYLFYVRESGTNLIEVENTELIESTEKVFNYIEKYKVTITANCDYFYKSSFATIEKLN